MEYNTEQLIEIYKTLPEDIKNALDSVDTLDAVEEIGIKYKLHMDQEGVLNNETGKVLLGLTDPVTFVDTISSKLGIDRTIASQIVGDINEKILLKVKDSLKQIHRQKSGESEAQTPVKVEPATPPKENVIQKVETSNLNVPQKTVDVLQGKSPEEKKPITNFLGMQVPPKPVGFIDIVEEKMKGGINILKSEVNLGKTEEKPKAVIDPYREIVK